MLDEQQIQLDAMQDADEVLGSDIPPELRTLFIQGWIRGFGRGLFTGADATHDAWRDSTDQLVNQIVKKLEDRSGN